MIYLGRQADTHADPSTRSCTLFAITALAWHVAMYSYGTKLNTSTMALRESLLVAFRSGSFSETFSTASILVLLGLRVQRSMLSFPVSLMGYS